MLARNGVVSITAAISPYREIRDEVRKRTQATFVEVYVETPLEILEERDTKGLYKKARAGIIKNFTGISDPYEEPLHPEVAVHTGKESIEESAGKILAYLEAKGLVGPAKVRAGK
jgi:adenylylsulfate kinase